MLWDKLVWWRWQRNMAATTWRSFRPYIVSWLMLFYSFRDRTYILLMEEIRHQLISSSSHYFQGFIHPRWCMISSINSVINFKHTAPYWQGVIYLPFLLQELEKDVWIDPGTYHHSDMNHLFIVLVLVLLWGRRTYMFHTQRVLI